MLNVGSTSFGRGEAGPQQLSATDAAAFLADLPGTSYLEVGGRDETVALELARRGNKVIQADPGDLRPAQTVACVYWLTDGFCLLLSPDAQRAALRFASESLAPEGRAVIECDLTDPQLLRPAKHVAVQSVTDDGVDLVASSADFVRQRLTCADVRIVDGSAQISTTEKRFVWPHELDLMAELAGLRLAERWATFRREEFTRMSPRFVSVYEPWD